MGSDQRFDYSVLGDAVNLAARLEGQTKSYGVKTLIGEDTKSELNDEFVTLELDNLAVKGKTEPVTIYTVLGTTKSLDENTAYHVEVKVHEEMMKLYKAKQFDMAIKFCEDLKRCFGGEMTEYYKMWQQRCLDCKDNVPDDWDGVYRATSK